MRPTRQKKRSSATLGGCWQWLMRRSVRKAASSDDGEHGGGQMRRRPDLPGRALTGFAYGILCGFESEEFAVDRRDIDGPVLADRRSYRE